MSTFSKRLLGLFALFVLIISFQNCTQTTLEGASPTNASLAILEGTTPPEDPSSPANSDVRIEPVATCSQTSSMEFLVAYRTAGTYQCYDYTTQSSPNRGAICQSGPEILGINPIQTSQNCMQQPTICGIQPTLVEVTEPGSSITTIKYSYKNLPLGCKGHLSIFEETGSGLSLHRKIALDIPTGSCKTCPSGKITCGACPVENASAGTPQTPPACAPGSQQACAIENGQGLRTCNAQGGWNICMPSSCRDGYVKDGPNCRAKDCLDYINRTDFKPVALSLVHTGQIYGEYAAARQSNLVVTGADAYKIASLAKISRQDYVDGDLASSSNPIFDAFESSATNLRFKFTHVNRLAAEKPQGSIYKVRFMCGHHLVAEASTAKPVKHAGVCAPAASQGPDSPSTQSILAGLYNPNNAIQSGKVIYNTISYHCNNQWNATGSRFEFNAQRSGQVFTYDSTSLNTLGAHCTGQVNIQGNMTAVYLNSSGQVVCMSDRAMKKFSLSK